MTISELIIQTNNLKETESFYSNILNFKISERTNSSITFKVGHSKLTFELTDNQINPKYHFAFNIPVNKLDDTISWISKKTPLIEADDKNYIANFENWKARAIYFYDNNKNILEFICRTDLSNSSEVEFSSESILNINEVGVVSEEPLKLGNQIIEKTKIDFFSKGPKRDDFAALGDENGLFVISNPDRNWYPTKDKAEKQKVKVKINVEEDDFELEFN